MQLHGNRLLPNKLHFVLNNNRWYLLSWLCVLLPFTGVRAQCPEIVQWDSISTGYSYKEKVCFLLGRIRSADAANDPRCAGNWCRRLGAVYNHHGELKLAIGAYLDASRRSALAGDIVSSASTMNQVGGLYYTMGLPLLALESFVKAANLYEQHEMYRGVADASGNAAEICLSIDSIALATQYANRSMAARLRSEYPADIGYNYCIMAMLNEKQGHDDSALNYYDKAAEAFRAANDTLGIIPVWQSKAAIYLRKQQWNDALLLYRKAFDTATLYHDRPLQISSVNGLLSCYEAQNDTPAAYSYLTLKMALTNTLLDQEKINSIIQSERKYETERLAKEALIKDQQIERSHLMLSATLIISALILCIAALLVLMSRSQKKVALKETELQRKKVDELMQQQEIENVNSLLKGQNNERRRIAQDLHDRLGSLLATVKLHFSNVEESIGKLQQQQERSYREANHLLDEACEEVRRISHDLYEGSLEKFGFMVALNQLIQAIEKTNAVQVTLIANNAGDAILKPNETDLYRITQELLSNTLKYAGARTITIQLTLQGHTLQYLYEDDGNGFDRSALFSNNGIGYKNILSRIEKMHASWNLDTSPGHGMTLVIEIPVA
jgi:signal transduction histidine kinase